jgi:hypothetical protein
LCRSEADHDARIAGDYPVQGLAIAIQELAEDQQMTHDLTKQQRILGLTAIVKDLLQAALPWHVPGGETLSLIVERELEKRNRKAFEDIVSELERGASEGVFEQDDVSEFVQMVLRIVNSMSKGTARRNLRLLARVIIGLKRNQAFEFDRFQRWANVLETLTRNEIILLGRAYRVLQREPPPRGQFWSLLRDDLVPNTFSGAELAELAAALLRTGLLLPVPALGNLNYVAGDSLKELGALAELERDLDDI